MKKIDPNNFIIDRLFDAIDKAYKKKKKKDKKKNKKVKSDVINITEEPNNDSKPSDNEYYTININV